MARETKEPSRFLRGQSQEIFNSEDPVALFGSIVRTPSFRDLLPSSCEDIGHFAEDRGV
jgi:hypothetical protein